MGGYGALINGLKYSDTFGCIGAFSAGLILDDIINETDFLKGFGWKKTFWERMVGKPETLRGSEADYCFLIENLQEQKEPIPEIYLAIGKDDFLYERNQEYCQFLKERNVKFTYEEGEGSHEWDFWDRHLKKFLDWLPLEKAEAGLNSGNVRNS